MQNTSTFIFQGWEILEKEIHFHYVLKKGEGEYNFTEKLFLPEEIIKDAVPYELLESLLNNLLLILGISYWKTFCPQTIKITQFALSEAQAAFWNTVYTKGLGEFFYKNKIDFHGLVQFPFAQDAQPPFSVCKRKDRSLLLVGGGKDSIVSGELLKKAKKQFSTFVVNEHAVQTETIRLLGAEKITLKRQVDPLLLELNRQKDVYNGHIPASAQYAFLGLLAAVLYDYGYVIASNEQSASFGNVLYLGEEINHQWSKSEEFELLFQNYVASYITQSVQYFSLLRPLSEIAITKIFSQYEQYFPSFSSCNKNFRITGGLGSKRWCGECPKCLFVFTLLTAFLLRETLLTIFGKDLFADERLLPLFKELLGIGTIKPFECVGTPEEVKVALFIAHQKGEFETSPLMQFFVKDVLPTIQHIKELKAAVFSLSENNVPKAFHAVYEDTRITT